MAEARPSSSGEMVDDRIRQVLVALKDGLGAAGAAVFDDDRTSLYLSIEPSAGLFWEGLREMECLGDVDWAAWCGELRASKHLSTTCACGREHPLHSFLFLERWVLLVIARGPLLPGAEVVMSSAARVLAGLLPALRVKIPPTGGGGGGGPDPARLGIPLSWLRKTQS
jgi:hypothetical protein